MKKLSLAVAAALFLTTGASFAASLAITPAAATAAPGAGNPTNPTPIAVQWDNTGCAAQACDSIDGQVLFDATKLSVVTTGDCAPGAPGEVIVAAVQLQSNTIPSGSICNMTFTTLAGAAAGNVIAIDLANTTVGTDGVAIPMANQPPATDGVVNIVVVPANPTTISFAPTTVNLTNGGGIAGATSAASIVAVTSAGGVDPGSYSCTVPAGFQLTNATNAAIPANSDPADISVTCTLAAAAFQGTSVCTRTGGAPVNLTLNCPTPAGPVLSSTPASGTALTCDGSPLSTTTTQVTISNTGTANITGATCSTVGAGFSVQQQPTATILPGASSNVIVSCSVPAEGAPAATGTLNCTTTAPAGGALTFPLSALGSSGAVPTQPATIPSTSLWAKIGLIGLLAALGALMVGFRRHS